MDFGGVGGRKTAHDHGVSAGKGPGTRLPCMITGPFPSTAPRYAMTTGTSGQPRPRRPDRPLPQRGQPPHDAPLRRSGPHRPAVALIKELLWWFRDQLTTTTP